MSAEMTLLALALLLIIAIIVQPRFARVRLPFAATLLLAGFAGSEVLVALGYPTTLDYRLLHTTVFYGLLPLLVFSAAFRMDTSALREQLTPILAMALPMPLAIFALISGSIYLGIGHPGGFPWSTALVAGAILTATEPFPLLGKLRKSRRCRRIAVILQAEGLVTVALAVSLYQISVELATTSHTAITAMDVLLGFVLSVGGGAVTGVLFSLMALWLSRRLQSPEQQALVAVAFAYVSFLASDLLLSVSGIVSALVTGWFFGRATRVDFTDTQEAFQQSFWSFLSHIAGAAIFLLMGITFTLPLFEERWLAMLIGVAAVLLVRIPQTFVSILTFRVMPRVQPLDPDEVRIGYAAGLRGAVALALAISLPVSLPGWWTVQALVFGVVLFALLVQAPVASLLIERRGRNDGG